MMQRIIIVAEATSVSAPSKYRPMHNAAENRCRTIGPRTIRPNWSPED